MNATVKVNYSLSDEYRRARLIEAGEDLNQRQTIEIDLATATEAERTAIVNWTGIDLHEIKIEVWRNAEQWQDRKLVSDYLMLFGIPSVQDVAGHCLRMCTERIEAQRVHDEWMREKVAEDIAKTMQQMREHLANRTIGNDVDLRSSLNGDRKRLEVNLSDYNTLRAEYDAWEIERKAQIAAEHAENERKREQAKVAKEAEKLAWVKGHGSEYLQRACAAGHDCSRMYWRERAAHEFPGYVVDIENDGAWKSRSCPSIEALDERDAVLAAHPGVSVEIVWLTEMPSDRKQDQDDYEEFEPCEAVVVQSTGLPESVYPYDLVKVL